MAPCGLPETIKIHPFWNSLKTKLILHSTPFNLRYSILHFARTKCCNLSETSIWPSLLSSGTSATIHVFPFFSFLLFFFLFSNELSRCVPCCTCTRSMWNERERDNENGTSRRPTYTIPADGKWKEADVSEISATVYFNPFVTNDRYSDLVLTRVKYHRVLLENGDTHLII